MIAVYAPVPRQQFHDGNGPISGGRVTYYEAGTSTPKEIYSAPDGLTPILNPQILDQDGYVLEGGVFYGEGSYKLVVEKPVSPVAPGEIPGFVEVYGSAYDGTYVRQADDLLGNPTWELDSDPTLRIKISGGLYFLYSTAAPAVALSTRSEALGIFGVWSLPGMTVGYPAYEIYWTMDNIAGAPVADPTQSASFLPLMEDLRALDAGVAGQLVYISGYYEIADGGEGWFAWDASSVEADNGGTIIAPPSSPATGRWLRLLEEEYLTPNLFGSIPDSALVSASNQQAMANWATSHPLYKVIRIPRGEYNLGGNLIFTNLIHLIVEDGAKYVSPDLSATLTITCESVEMISRSPIVDPDEVTLEFDPVDVNVPYRPEWAGPLGSGEGVVDDWDTFGRIAGNTLGGRETLMEGRYALIGTGAASVSIGKGIFGQGSALICSFSNRQVQIGSYRTIGDVEDIFTGDAPQAVGLVGQREFIVRHMSLLTPGEVSAADLTRIAGIATSDGSYRRRIVWDSITALTFTEDWDAGITDNALLLDWSAVPGASLIFQGNVLVPTFSGGAAISLDGGSPRFGCEIDPRWFGALPDTTDATVAAANSIAIAAAIDCATVSYPSELVGGGSRFHVADQVLSGDYLTGASVAIRELTLKPVGSWGSTYVVKLEHSGLVDLREVTVETTTNSLWLTAATASVIRDSNFGGDVQNDAAQMKASRTDFVGDLAASFAVPSDLRDCSHWGDVTIDGSSGSVTGCQFEDCDLIVRDPARILISGNSFMRTSADSVLQLNGVSAGWVVTGLIVVDNIWSSGTPYTGITVSNMASTGHNAHIDRNRGGNVVVPGSIARVRHTETANTLVVPYWTSNVSLTGLYILPFSTVPVRALMQQVGNTVTAGRENLLYLPILSGTVRGTAPAALANVALGFELQGATPFFGDTYDFYLEFTISDVD
jgi:hypothetical protein